MFWEGNYFDGLSLCVGFYSKKKPVAARYGLETAAAKKSIKSQATKKKKDNDKRGKMTAGGEIYARDT